MKNLFILTTIFISAILLLLILSSQGDSQVDSNPSQDTKNVYIEDGKQIIMVTATGTGYFPRKITADANIQTVLKMDSRNSYGCERSFRIPQMDINQVLPVEGITEFDLGVPKNGQEVFGTCSMGMYTFTINFES